MLQSVQFASVFANTSIREQSNAHTQLLKDAFTHSMKDVTNHLPQHANIGMQHNTDKYSQNNSQTVAYTIG